MSVMYCVKIPYKKSLGSSDTRGVICVSNHDMAKQAQPWQG